MSSEARRYFIVPDTQIAPGRQTIHVTWAARAIVDYKPDVVVMLGDWWDMPSLSTHDAPGSRQAEGRNVKSDIDAGNEAFALFNAPIQAEIDRLVRNKRKRWTPELHILTGNHEDRITRAIALDPRWDGQLSLDHLQTPGWTRHPYLKILERDGIKFCHFFPHPHSGRAIGGTIVNRLNSIGSSFVQGHQQGFLYASRQYPDHVKHGLVAGRFYLDHESYRAEDVQRTEWSGCVVLNEVWNGQWDLMPLSMNYLRRKYA